MSSPFAAGLERVASSGTAPRPAAAARVARVALLGATGYSGQEFLRLALSHPGIQMAALGARDAVGAPLETVAPGLEARAAELPPLEDPRAIAAAFERGAADTLVSALPHGAWRALARELPALAAEPARIVDLSADHRAGEDGYVYGLPEAFREEIAAATRIANPGCYPTALALALAPAAERLGGAVTVVAVSGVSGAGRSAGPRGGFVELEGGASIYRAGTEHPHVAEMERTLARFGAPVPVGFVPQLAPMARGILLTATAPLDRALAPEEARALYLARYAAEPFVRVLPAGAWPETRAVRQSNRCDLAVTTIHAGRTLLATAAIDNLVKGAAGQALQNLNLLLGWPETTGLSRVGCPW